MSEQRLQIIDNERSTSVSGERLLQIIVYSRW
jgi:hypothetical protein